MRFADRRHAGEHLGRLVAAAGPEDPVVYGLPRGGVPVGYEVARALGCPFDVVIVRKIGVPSQPELAMGAVAEGGVVVRNDELVAAARISEETFAGVLESERIELDKRVASYRDGTEAVSPIDGTAIVVDDGLATGSTALAAVSVLETMGARSVWLAVPVAPAAPFGDLEARVDRMVVSNRPRHFGSVGSWYRDFSQTSDAEVRDLLARSRLP